MRIAVVTTDASHPEQCFRCRRGTGRHSVVEQVTWPDDQLLVIGTDIVEALISFIPEQLKHLICEVAGNVEPRMVKSRGMNRYKSVDEMSVVFQIPKQVRCVVFPRS